jgi:amino acid adenylation domain-containing protein
MATEGGWPLTPLQRRLWTLAECDGAAAYRAAATVQIDGAHDPDRVVEALSAVVARHEILRTSFEVLSGTTVPVQVVRDGMVPAVERRAWTAESELGTLGGDGLAARLLVGPSSSILILELPGLASDGGTLRTLVRELALGYRGEVHSTSPLQLADVGEWQREMLAGEPSERWQRFARTLSRGGPIGPRLPGEREASGAFVRDVIRWSPPAGLDGVARSHEVSTWQVVLAAWLAVIARLSGEETAVVGVTPDARRWEELAGAMGPLERVVPLAMTLAPERPVAHVLRALAAEMRQVEEDQETFGWGALAPTPFLAAGFVYDEAEEVALPGGPRFTLWRRDVHSDRFTVRLGMALREGQRTLELEYDLRRLDAGAAASLARTVAACLESVIADPAQPLGRLRMLSAVDRRRCLVEWNATASEATRGAPVHEIIAAQAARTPEAIAVAAGECRLTFAGLEARSARLARRLRRLGVGPGDLVAIALEREPDVLVALLGVLKAGGAYVPLELGDPEARQRLVLDDARPLALVTHVRHASRGAGVPHVICLDAADDPGSSDTDLLLVPRVTPDDLAYVLYTSGSTGTPKGAMITHRGLTNYLLWAVAAYEVGEGAGAPVHSPLGFDLTVTSLLAPLLAGRCVELVPDEFGLDGLTQALRGTRGWSLVKITPAHLDALARLLPPADVATATRTLVIGGEALRHEQLAFWRRYAPGTRLVNEYGPTETVVGCCVHEVTAADDTTGAVPIGRPIANTRLYVLDADMEPVPIGVAGELYIGGDGVARGYLDRAALTAQRFVADPFVPGGRLYRSGDLARWRPDGVLEFLGRTDHQVKVRGHRVELGEIEAVLAQHPAVRECVVVARREADETRLVAHVVAGDVDTRGLRAFLRGRLPEHMLPTTIVSLAALPLTTNGKVDRAALPEPEPAPRDRPCVAPRDDVETALTRIWEESLGVRPIGVTDDFFDLGGHSLLAVRVMFQVRIEFPHAPPLGVMFAETTIERQAAILRERRTQPTSVLVPIESAGSTPPFFCVHPAGGHVLGYVDLARLLGPDRPVYGLQAQGLDGLAPPHETIEEMAACYLSAVREVQPCGPYHLGGASLGGVVAFEMAHRLVALGERVALVALLDSPAPEAMKSHPSMDETSRWMHLATVMARFLGKPLRFTLEEVRQLDPEAQWRFVLDQAVETGLVPPGLGLETARRFVEVHRLNDAALRRYVPVPYPGELTLFRAAEAAPDTDSTSEAGRADETLGWQSFSTRPVRVAVVPGNHITMMARPHVAILAERLRARLAEVGATHGMGVEHEEDGRWRST